VDAAWTAAVYHSFLNELSMRHVEIRDRKQIERTADNADCGQYHLERNHQGLENRLIVQMTTKVESAGTPVAGFARGNLDVEGILDTPILEPLFV
jgi:hypothetical protein